MTGIIGLGRAMSSLTEAKGGTIYAGAESLPTRERLKPAERHRNPRRVLNRDFRTSFTPPATVDFNGPLPDNPAKWLKQVIGEREAQYTYSIRTSIEEEKARKAALDRLAGKS